MFIWHRVTRLTLRIFFLNEVFQIRATAQIFRKTYEFRRKNGVGENKIKSYDLCMFLCDHVASTRLICNFAKLYILEE